jgi:hypothetical protein
MSQPNKTVEKPLQHSVTKQLSSSPPRPTGFRLWMRTHLKFTIKELIMKTLFNAIVFSALGSTFAAQASPVVRLTAICTDWLFENQFCVQPQMPLNVHSDGKTGLYIRAKAPSTHCAPVNYVFHVSATGFTTSTYQVSGRFLNAGQAQLVALPILSEGPHSILVTASSYVAGCNVGRLGSWAGDFNFETAPD